jgi:hypothetical protein
LVTEKGKLVERRGRKITGLKVPHVRAQGSGITRRIIMRKSVVDALFKGVSSSRSSIKTGIFALMAASGLRLRVKHKKIASRRLQVSRSCSLQARLTRNFTGEVKAIVAIKKGALPLFVQSQKLGAESCTR